MTVERFSKAKKDENGNSASGLTVPIRLQRALGENPFHR